MRRINLEPLMTLSDGSQLVISTQHLRNGDFSCALYSATIEGDDRAVIQMNSNHLAASTCLGAQAHEYNYAVRLYPRATMRMKKLPYLIWPGHSPVAKPKKLSEQRHSMPGLIRSPRGASRAAMDGNTPARNHTRTIRGRHQHNERCQAQ